MPVCGLHKHLFPAAPFPGRPGGVLTFFYGQRRPFSSYFKKNSHIHRKAAFTGIQSAIRSLPYPIPAVRLPSSQRKRIISHE